MNCLHGSHFHSATRSARVRGLIGFLTFLCFFGGEADAAGLFGKKQNRKSPATQASPKRKPFQGIFAPKPPPPTLPLPRTEPAPRSRLPRAMPVTTAEPVGAIGALPIVPRAPGSQVRIFVLGDSQGLLPFGTELQKTLVEQGHEVLFHAVKNGTPYYWNGRWPSAVLTRTYTPASTVEECGRWEEVSMQPRSVADYVASVDPDVFLFQAGTNFEEDLAGESPTQIVALIQESLRQAGARGAKVLWIGPPDARDDVKPVEFQDRASATLRSALADLSARQGYESFFDSRPVCPIPNGTSGDGEHPSDENGRLWGVAAGTWAGEAIRQWQKKGALRPAGATPIAPTTPGTSLLSNQLESESLTPGLTFTAELELIAKSDPGDIRTLPYTDAFSVFQYRLRNPDQVLPLLMSLGLSVTSGEGGPILYVMHWTVHNNGNGPRLTRIASRQIGELHTMQLCPLARHPLAKPLGTMTQFNDFDDFLAPVFVAADLLEERAY